MAIGGGIGALLAGLGSIPQAYQQAQQQNQRQQAMDAELARTRAQMNADSLIGDWLGLSQGNKNPMGGGLGLGANGSPAPGPPAAASPSPAPMMPMPAQAPPQMPQPAPAPLADTPIDAAPPGMPDADASTLARQEAGELPQAPPMPVSSPEIRPQVAAAAHTIGDPASAEPSPAGGFIMRDPVSGATFDTSMLFHRVSPQDIARQIKAVRPDADPLSLAYATEKILKMSQSGDRYESMAAMAMFKQLFPSATATLNAQTRYDVTQMQQAGAGERAAAGREAASQRQQSQQSFQSGQQQKRLDAVMSRMLTREGRVDGRAAVREADRMLLDARRRGDQDTARQISGIRAQIAAITAQNPGMAPSAENQKKLEGLANQLALLGGTANAGPGEATLPPPVPPAPGP